MAKQTSIMNTQPYAYTKSSIEHADCGCNGSNCCGGDCHCGSGSHATCGCNEGLLVQPHFFAGQLLTDEDLQALTNYMVTKHRLHNRYVVGSGVSCGLAVTCHPCGQGKVIVQPGYAIDCCGNDILVPCPVELDINAMARELKLKRLGHDCGDPCKENLKKGGEQSYKDCGDPADHYCLYLRYCELPTDPVAPYTHDESCNTTCQPSRLREGFSFELRCPEEEDCPPSLIDRIRCCIGDLDEAELQAKEFERVQLYLQRAAIGLQAYKLNQPAKFADEDASSASKLNNSLGNLLDQKSGSVPLEESTHRGYLDAVQTLGAIIVRWDLQIEKEERNTDEEIIKKSREILNELVPQIESKIGNMEQFLSSKFEAAIAKTMLDNTLEFIDTNGKTRSVSQSFNAFLYAYNCSTSSALTIECNRALANFKNWLLRKMHQCPPTTECGLVKEVSTVVIPTADTISEATISAVDALVRAFIRYLLDCVCSALIPPCPTCEDPVVKLACLEVKDCEVDNICNLERTFLLTEHNLRYWLPFLHWFGEALEYLCCQFSKWFDKQMPYQTQSTSSQTTYFISGQQKLYNGIKNVPVYPFILRVTGLADAPIKSTLNFGEGLSKAVLRQPRISAFEQLGVKKPIQWPTGIQSRTNEVRTTDAFALEAVEEKLERTSSQIKEIEKDLSKQITDNKQASTREIKKLEELIKRQKDEIEKLTTHLKELAKEGPEK